MDDQPFSESLFSPSEIEQVGLKHNEVVINVYDKISSEVNLIDCNRFECLDEKVAAKFKTVGNDFNVTISELEISYARDLNLSLNSVNYDFKKWKDHNLNATVLQSLMQIQDYIYETKNMGTSYNYLDEKLETYQSQILQDISLSSTDKTIIDGTIEIAQNSAYLWMPKELGGLGLSLGLGQYHADERTNEDGCWDNIVAGDAAASASFWTTLGVSSILGAVPGTNTVILGGWAITAGLGSTFAGLMCEDCP